MKYDLEIVSHCWNYARIGLYQLSSLVLFPPPVKTLFTLYYSRADESTSKLVEFFRAMPVPNLEWSFRDIPTDSLMIRSIGRNEAALATEAKWVWFIDVDMAIGQNAISQFLGAADAAVLKAGHDIKLCYPGTIFKTSHADGDAMTNAASGDPRVIDIDRSKFTIHRYPRAIGGVQLVSHATCHALGYCKDNKRLQTPCGTWGKMWSDVVFRQSVGTSGVKLPHVDAYRISHSKRGRHDIGIVL